MDEWLIYGANGYTGELIAREAVARGMRPVLAGRSEAPVRDLAGELALDYRVFDLSGPGAVDRGLAGVGLVSHCAGPFSATAEPMLEGCLRSGCHYLDITGEIDVFVHAQAQHKRADEAGIVVCPGSGFDVVPTDCLAAALHDALPDATRLSLGFDSRSGMSQGTAKTSVEGLAKGGRVRQGGQIASVPLAYETRRIDFGDGEKWAMTIPWGDVATAGFTTGIPDISVFVPASPALIKNLKRINRVRALLKLGLVQRFLKSRIEKGRRGPDSSERRTQATSVWGEACNDAGRCITGRIKTANGYALTVTAMLGLVETVLGGARPGGYYTPSMLAGKTYVETLPGSGRIEISS